MPQIKPSPKPVRIFYFWSGIIATFAYRIIIIINNYSKDWAQISWYIGTIGFVIYFLHRYQVSEKRADLIRDYKLIEKTQKCHNLQGNEKEAIGYILNTLLSTKEKWNYIFIFLMSIIAFIIGIYLDFVKQ